MRQNIVLNRYNFLRVFLLFFLLFLVVIFLIILSLLSGTIIPTIISILLLFVQAIINLLMKSDYNDTASSRKDLEDEFIDKYNVYENYLINSLFNNENVFPSNKSFFSNIEIYVFYSSILRNNKFDIKTEKYKRLCKRYEDIIPYTMSYFEYYFFLKTKDFDYYYRASFRLIKYDKKYKELLNYKDILVKKVTKIIHFKPIINTSVEFRLINIKEDYERSTGLYIKSVIFDDYINNLSNEIISFILREKNDKKRDISHIIINLNPKKTKLYDIREDIQYEPYIINLIINILSNNNILKLESFYFINDMIHQIIKKIKFDKKITEEDIKIILREHNINKNELDQIDSYKNVYILPKKDALSLNLWNVLYDKY
ncbi:MAG: hypothetical protein LBH44_12065 [Treponema sp.]|jgi:hypothetical protein|nr:hypothetical protein [Treponema sp.]